MHTNTQADLGITSIRQPTCEEDEKVKAAKTFKASLCLAAEEAQSSLKDYSKKCKGAPKRLKPT